MCGPSNDDTTRVNEALGQEEDARKERERLSRCTPEFVRELCRELNIPLPPYIR